MTRYCYINIQQFDIRAYNKNLIDYIMHTRWIVFLQLSYEEINICVLSLLSAGEL